MLNRKHEKLYSRLSNQVKQLSLTCQNDPSVDQDMFKELGEVPRPNPFIGASMYSEIGKMYY